MNITTNKRERNIIARGNIKAISENHGVSFVYLAKQMGVKAANFNHWRRGSYEYGSEKLKDVESIIERYTIR